MCSSSKSLRISSPHSEQSTTSNWLSSITSSSSFVTNVLSLSSHSTSLAIALPSFTFIASLFVLLFPSIVSLSGVDRVSGDPFLLRGVKNFFMLVADDNDDCFSSLVFEMPPADGVS